MGQYVNDFTSYPLSTKLDDGSYDWILLGGATDWTFDVIEDARGASGRVLRTNRAGFASRAWWRWTDVPSSSEGEMYIEYIAGDGSNSAAGARQAAPLIFSNTNSDATAGYFGGDIAGGGSNVVRNIRNVASPTTTGVTEGVIAFEANRKRSTLMQWEDTGTVVNLRLKTWWTDESEPGSFQINTTSASLSGAPYNSSGFSGFGRFESGATEGRLCFLGVGTDGDPAPRSVPSSGPISFSGTIPTLNGTEGVPFSEDLSSYFTVDFPPASYALQSGSLAGSGLTLNSSTGVISGSNPVLGSYTGLVIRGTDDNLDTADSNSFTISIAAAGSPPVLSSPTGVETGDTTATFGATTDTAEGTLYGVLTTSATPPSAADIKAGTGAAFADSQAVTTTGAKTFNATGLTASTTYYGHLVHTDTDGDSNIVTTAAFTTEAAPAANTLTFTNPLKNNTGTVQANLTGLTATVIDMTTRESVLTLTGQTTNGSGVPEPISDVALVTADDYRVVFMSADGTAVGVSEIITAS